LAGTPETVPSEPISRRDNCGTLIGWPVVPSTGLPALSARIPALVICRLPSRLIALPVGVCTSSQASPLTATSKAEPVCCSGPAVRSGFGVNATASAPPGALAPV
jgi:hypothetical protein